MIAEIEDEEAEHRRRIEELEAEQDAEYPAVVAIKAREPYDDEGDEPVFADSGRLVGDLDEIVFSRGECEIIRDKLRECLEAVERAPPKAPVD